MSLSPNEKYPGATEADPNYKDSKFKDNNPSTTNNGSPLKALDRNEQLALQEAMMNAAGFDYNGVVDTPQNSQMFNAYKAALSNGANLLSNHNFIIASPDDSQPTPSATPTSYPPGYEIFSGVFANESTGILNLTYIDGRVSFSGGDFYMAVPNTGALENITEFVASVADFDGKPRTRGVSYALVGDEYRVTVGVDALEDESANETLLGSVKLEQGSVATGHEVDRLRSKKLNADSIQSMVSTTFNVGDVISTGTTSWKVIPSASARSIALAGGLFAIALNGIWPTDAGAVVDGVTDDHPAIQYCVDLKTAPVMLHEGDWRIDSEVIYYDKSVIRGLSKEGVRILHPNSAMAFKSESFNLVDTDTTRFEIGRVTFIGGWDNRPASENLIPQSAIYVKGYDYDIHDVDLEQYGGVGIYATSTDPTTLVQANEHIESYVRRVKASKCYDGGVFLESPTDSFIEDVIVIALGDDDWGDTNYSPTNFGIKTGAGAGAAILSKCHCYGYMQYTYSIFGGSSRLYDCVGEGGILGQVYVGVDGVQISRGRYFSGYKADGTSIRTVNQGIVVAENVKDCKFETDIFFCNEGGVVFLGAGSGGHNIVECVIFATDNGGAAATPVQIVGATNARDTITLRYQQGVATQIPTGIAPQLTTNGKSSSTIGQLTLGNTVQTKVGDANIFEINRTGLGLFEVTFIRPYPTTTYIVGVTLLSDHSVKVLVKSTNKVLIETRSMPSYILSDGAIIDLSITGLVV